MKHTIYNQGDRREEHVETSLLVQWTSLVAQVVKNLPVMQETWVGFLGQEDSLGEGNGNLIQYSCLENPMDSRTWRATVHGVTKSRT